MGNLCRQFATFRKPYLPRQGLPGTFKKLWWQWRMWLDTPGLTPRELLYPRIFLCLGRPWVYDSHLIETDLWDNTLFWVGKVIVSLCRCYVGNGLDDTYICIQLCVRMYFFGFYFCTKCYVLPCPRLSNCLSLIKNFLIKKGLNTKDWISFTMERYPLASCLEWSTGSKGKFNLYDPGARF